MKGTNRSWRAQKGTAVQYATSQFSGRATVVAVLEAERRFRVRDALTGVEHEVAVEQIRLVQKER